ncbi:hypothetical protein LZU96_21545 (plasmid) [Pantoea agglomerans]|uniref:hypothetical protein n=1 Tax=Enterobacter agglomerans TaxID=549 RepID=UPI001F303E5C|nr:hypothetical protein [Pantoea agglomerans]UIL54732.1 hypothetical protein LZU96_21545 [Pantoea agglomerans]
MKELQESLLATTLEKLAESFHQVAEGMKAQTEAINRLAESNEALASVVYQAFANDIEITSLDDPTPRYLSGKPKG